MKKYRVHGTEKVGICIEVEAESAEAALDAAYEQWPGLTGFCGNGGSDKLVGVYDGECSLYPLDDAVEFESDSTEEIEE